MSKNFYAVKIGKVPGVYKTWDECKTCVDQYPGAKYKGFETEDEAWAFVNGDKDTNDNYNGVIAYVDGSFDLPTFRYSYGVAVIDGDKEVHLSGVGNDHAMAQMRNVAGEIMGAMAAMQYAKDNGIKEIMIAHDYQGIRSWATREWKCNKPETEAYRDFYDKISKDVKIRFQKVKGHSGDKYNDLVDALAKRALGIEIKKSVEAHILAVENRCWATD